MQGYTNIERDEESEITTIDAEGTKIDITIYRFNDTVKLEDHISGSAFYFRSIDEVERLRDMLNVLLQEGPIIKPR